MLRFTTKDIDHNKYVFVEHMTAKNIHRKERERKQLQNRNIGQQFALQAKVIIGYGAYGYHININHIPTYCGSI